MSASQRDLQAYISQLSQFQNEIAFYSCLIIGNMSFASNILNILVCMRKKHRKEALGFYNPLMSVFNILSTMFGYLSLFPMTIGGQDLQVSSDYACILISYMGRICVQMSSWLNVMISFDRMITISYPYRFKRIRKRDMLSKFVLGLLLAITLVNTPNLLFSVVITETRVFNATTNQSKVVNVAKACTCKFSSTMSVVRDLIAQLMRSALPIVLECVLNTLLIYKLIISRKNLTMQRSLHKDYKFAFTIVMLNAFFFITQIPLLISLVYLNVLNYQQPSAVPSKNLILAYFLYIVAAVFASCMYSTVFFVNIFFNKHFRAECVASLSESLTWCVENWEKTRVLVHTSVLSGFKFESQRVFDKNLKGENASMPVLVSFKRQRPDFVVAIQGVSSTNA